MRSPAAYCYQTVLMGTLVLHEAFRAGVSKFVTLIGGCSYPATAPSPIAETELWNGYPQAESASYSLAKRMMVVQAQAYRQQQQHGFDAIVLVPGNLYGPHDNFDLENAHVIPALIRKFQEARAAGTREVVVWGSGRPTRDCVSVEDVSEATLLAAESYSGPDTINISSGRTVTVRELVETIARLSAFTGRVGWDSSKPDGQIDKDFDVTRVRGWLGYERKTSVEDGLRRTLDWFVENRARARLGTVL